jgi:hypothetical protein
MAEKVYDEFRKAADRHLKTCLKLKEVIESETKADLKRKLLEDLYYLSGYIVECSCCYFIFSYNKKFKQLEKKTDLKPELDEKSDKNIAFSAKDGLSSATFVVKSSDHNMKHFKEAMKEYLTNFPTETPILNGQNLSPINEKLFSGWNANIRYKVPENIPLSEPNIISFLEMAKNVYDGVYNHLHNPKTNR